MASQEYWKEREARQRKNDIKNEREYRRHIEEIYQNMIDEIEKEINGFYGKYARKEGITIAEARKRAAKADIEAFGRKAKRYVKDKDFSTQANEEMRLYNMTMKVNRLELLKAQIGLEMVAGFDELEKYYKQVMTDQAIEEFERQAGILGKTVINRMKAADAIVNSSFHNATFSDRIWMYQDMLKNELNSLLQTGLIQGQNPRRLATHLRKRFGVSQSNAERLMITELARVQTEAQKQSFERNGFEEYTFLALGNACSKCKKLDEKHFEVKDMMPGENAPPMHPYCRCSIAAYEDSEDYEAWLDFLDKGGTTEEWNRLKNEEKSDKIQLTEDEKRALLEYKSFQSYKINELLRNNSDINSLPEEEKIFVRTLDSALSKIPKYQGNLLRTIDFSDWPNSQRKADGYANEFVLDETIIIDQYWSTSKGVGYNKNANVKIYIQNAKNGRDISSVGLDEKEVLYERKSQFVVISKVFQDGIWNILLEEK
ncbi:MAG TPA: minor capsid protein [Candidatus Anaerostipes avistercoris]|uniref:Minor capsid protein n=1 Tax=Candidatus Anaerostipes avistercoris TaxID=2838462 RepID=A0A9D2PH18_9FIRM|nr:minor capsid protein [Candidatus Anaerostipes avistercoris]